MLPSLESIQIHQQMIANQQQYQGGQSSLLASNELQGPIGSTNDSSNNNWPPSPPKTTYNLPSDVNKGTTNNSNQSFLSKLFTCGGFCSIDALRPYFDIDTIDILVRMKSSITYCMVNDGFRNEVLYSKNALKIDSAPQTTSESENIDGGEAAIATSGKGPDLYGPIWITMTLVFFVAVTSNMSIYVHHSFKLVNKLGEGGVAAENEWDYDINQLLHATWILYSYSVGLPALLYVVFRMAGVNGLGLVDLICFYGYSLVAYLPVTWVCIVPIHAVQWTSLGVATVLSGVLVVRNVIGPILESATGPSGQRKSGGLIMSVIGCHFVFYVVIKLAFYHRT